MADEKNTTDIPRDDPTALAMDQLLAFLEQFYDLLDIQGQRDQFHHLVQQAIAEVKPPEDRLWRLVKVEDL